MQAERRGTAHAVLAARAAIARGAGRRPGDLRRHAAAPAGDAEADARRARAGAASSVLGFRPEDPTGYGRLMLERRRLVAIREERDASDVERTIDLCNGGLMALAGETALAILDRIGNANGKGEFYLTDAVAIARGMGAQGGRARNRGGRGARHQHQGAARRGRGGDAAAPARGRARRGRHPGRARNGVSVRRHQVRPRRRGRADRGVRAGRHGRGRRGDPRLLASRRRACRQGRRGRSLRAAAAGRAPARKTCASAISSRSRRP